MADSSVFNAASPQLVQAVRNLWEAGFSSEDAAFGSAPSQMLNHVCGSIYPEVSGSRLTTVPTDGLSRHELRDALRHFFRWTGAPWYGDIRNVSVEAAAARLHSAFLMESVSRTYLVPLDQLGLYTATRPHVPLRLSFGECEIAVLNEDELTRLVPIAPLKRFGRRFDPDRLAGFYYLIVRVREPAGPLWKRGLWSVLDETSVSVARIELYTPVFDEPVENAIFTILPNFLLKSLRAGPAKPFAIPWVYSVTDDPFSRPSGAPNPSRLTRTVVGEPDDEYEVPDQSNHLEFVKDEIEKALGDRWRRLQSALTRAANGNGNFHPLTKHFFIKAFTEDGIDEIVALISCVEATLMLPDERSTDKLLKRYKRLVNSNKDHEHIKLAYKVRNKYLHALGKPDDATTFDDMAKYRLAVVKAVDAYLTLADERRGEDREALLRSLKQ